MKDPKQNVPYTADESSRMNTGTQTKLNVGQQIAWNAVQSGNTYLSNTGELIRINNENDLRNYQVKYQNASVFFLGSSSISNDEAKKIATQQHLRVNF